MADPDYFTMAEFRAVPGMIDATKYPDARVLAVAASLTSIIERETGTSFIARNVTETLTSCNLDQIILESTYVQSITTVTLNGVSVTPTDLFLHNGLVQYKTPSTWFASGQRGNVVITYVSGRPGGVPADIKEALMYAVRDRLMATNPSAGIDARRTAMTTADGNTINYILAGEGRPTGYPDLDAAIMGWLNESGPSVG